MVKIMNKKEIRKVKKIQKSYSPKEAEMNEYNYLISLDRNIKKPAKIFSFIFGVLSALIFGAGMCTCLDYISGGMVLGVIIGCTGILMCVVNYPIYKIIKNNSAKKHKKEILSLSEKLLNKENN